MSKRSDYWASRRNDGKWSVKKAGANRSSSIHETQQQAWCEARRLARGTGSEAFLKGMDGKIRTRNSYGNDPHGI